MVTWQIAETHSTLNPSTLKKASYTAFGSIAGGCLLFLAGFYAAYYYYDGAEMPWPHLPIAFGTGALGSIGGGYLGYKLSFQFLGSSNFLTGR